MTTSSFRLDHSRVVDLSVRPLLENLEARLLLDSIPWPGAFVLRQPAGGLVYHSMTAGTFAIEGETDVYELDLDAAQTVTVRLTPQDAQVQGQVELFSPGGASLGMVSAGAAGQTVLAQTLAAATAGTYELRLSSLTGSGAYDVELVLNAAVEAETYGGADNATTGSAQGIGASSVALQGGANRLGVTGVAGNGADVYAFTLSAGDRASLALHVAGGDSPYPLAQYGVGDRPYGLAGVDLDGDGEIDLAAAMEEDGGAGECGIAILKGMGDGTFGAATVLQAGTPFRDVAAGDLDGDTDVDLVAVSHTADENVSIYVWLNDGSGAFGAPTVLGAGGTPVAVALGRMNAGASLDIVVATDGPYGGGGEGEDPAWTHAGVGVLLGDGTGTFGAVQRSALVNGTPADLVLGDLDGDAALDVLTANGGSDGLYGADASVSVFLGNGDGTLGSEQRVEVGEEPLALALGLLNGDNVLDLVTANGAGNPSQTLSVLMGTGDGTFGGASMLPVASGSPGAVVVADLDGDGRRDILSANGYWGQTNGASVISVFRGAGNGIFTLWDDLASGTDPMGLLVADLDGAGELDIAAINAGWSAGVPVSSVSVLLGLPPVSLEVLNSTGTVAAQGVDGKDAGVDECVSVFTAGAAGTYYARIAGGSGQEYALVITQQAQFELPADLRGQDVQPLGAEHQVLGHLGTSTTTDAFVALTDGFESGSLGGNWSTYTSDANGRIRVTTAAGAVSGSYALVLDRTSAAFGYSLEEAVWTVDLSGEPWAFLSFRHADLSDAQTAFAGSFTGHANADGVAISADGTTWYPIWNAVDQPAGEWTAYTIDLAAAAGSAGIALGADFRVKFQQYGISIWANTQGRGWDDVSILTRADRYSVEVKAGDELDITLEKPGEGGGEPAGDLSAMLRLYNEAGALVASDADLDGSLAWTAAGEGMYTVVLHGLSGAGDYTIRVEGATGGVNEDFHVDASVPADAALLAGFPAVYRVDLSLPVDPATVDAGDLLINGSPATHVTLVDGDTLEFNIASLAAGDGVYTVTLAAGALRTSANTPIQAFSASFDADTTPPTATLTGPLGEGGTTAPGDLTITVTFSEPLDAGVLDAADATLTSGGGDVVAASGFSYDVPSRILTLSCAGLTEGAYTLTLAASAAAFCDLRGNALDGDGNGTGGDAFILHFNVDEGERALASPLPVVLPRGSNVHGLPSLTWTPGRVSGVLHSGVDSDRFTIALDAGQSLSLALSPGDPGADSRIEVLAPGGAPLGSALGADGAAALLQSVAATGAGTYTIVVSSAGGGFGFDLYLLLNSEFEGESFGGPANDTRGTAQGLQQAGGQWAVYGADQGDADAADCYALDLRAGNVLSVASTCLGASQHVDLALLDPAGTVVALGVQDAAANVDEYIAGFVAVGAGTYCLRVVASTGASYSLAAIMDRALDVEDNDASQSARPVDAGGGFRGFLDDPRYDVEPDDFGAGSVLTTAVPGVTLIVEGQAGTVMALASTRVSTGALAFAHGPVASNAYWMSSDQWLRIDFDQGVDAVAMDAIAVQAWSNSWAVLEAYDASGTLLATVETPGGASGGTVYTLSVIRPRADIDHVRVSGRGGYQAALDNLVVGADKADYITIQPAAGQQVHLATTTPGDGAGEPANTLDPRIDVFTAAGVPVTADDNGAFDGRNAELSFVADGRTYIVRVSGTGRGVYEVAVTGAELTNTAPALINSVPADQQVLAHAPAHVDIVFSESLRADLLDPEGLVIDGVGSSTAAVLLDGRTVRYTVGLDAADLEGLYTYTLTPGAGTDLQGLASRGGTGSFFVDRTGPSVFTAPPLPARDEPFSQISMEFSEPIDPASVQKADVVRFTNPDGYDVNVSNVTVNGRILTITFAPAVREAGTYTFEIGPDIRDFVGNPMDQDGDGTYGEASDTFTGTVDLVLPDLSPESVSVAPSPSQFGQNVDVTWLVRNLGPGATSADWTLSFWLSSDNVLDEGTDQFLQGGPAGSPALAAGQAHGATTTVNIPFTLEAPSGTYCILVQADSADSLLEASESNNVGAGTLELLQAGMPDLVVSASLDAASIPVGGQLRAHWTVTNAAAASAEADWFDYVYLSPNATFEPATDRWIANVSAASHSPLAGGGHYDTDAAVLLPADVAPGNYFLLFVTDRTDAQPEQAEDNNVDAVAVRLTAPDLRVQWIDAPASARFGQTLDLICRVWNEGDSDVLVAWSDRVLLTPEGSVIPIDLGSVETTATIPLAAGAHHDQTITVALPLAADVAPGTYRLSIRTDSGLDVDESDEQNNTAMTDIDLLLPPLPNLSVARVVAPVDAWSGRQIPVEWDVTNAGTAAADGTWVDRVFLADNPQGLNGTAYADLAYMGRLEPGESVSRKTAIQLPDDLQGTWYVVVHTDQREAVFEHANEADNVNAGDPPMMVHLSAFSNLTVNDVEVAASAFAGQEIVVEWTVTNSGSGPTSALAWSDRLYLSRDLVLGQDVELGSVTNASYLASGESYRTSLAVVLPRDAEGPWYVLVKTDAQDQVTELDHEDDNTGASDAAELTVPPYADLRVVSVDAPPTAFGGEQIPLRFTVQNFGQGWTDANAWPDQIHLSTDAFLDPDDTWLKTVVHSSALAPDGAYTVATTVQLDDAAAGLYYFIVTADAAGGRTENVSAVFEHVLEGNNDGYDLEPTEVFPPPDPDLEAVSVDMPATGLAGHEVLLQWRYANYGPSPTPAGGRFDAFYLSTDAVRGGDDLLLRMFGAPYPAIQSGEVTGTVGEGFPLRLPDGIEGDFYVLFQLDSQDQVREIDEVTNNVVASTHTIHIESRPADLVVAWNAVPTAALAGQGVYVEWTVTNQGAGDSAVEAWTDTVYVGGTDLASVRHGLAGNGVVLGPGQSYTGGCVIELPATLEGVYDFYVMADASEIAGENGDVYEGDEEDNNETPRVPVTVTRNPADLHPTVLQAAPGVVASGQVLTVEWSVANLGTGPTTTGAWYDRVYLSTDDQLDPEQDILLGQQRHSGRVDGGDNYAVQTAFTVPIDVNGEYHVILSVDSGENGGAVLESNPDNNVRVSAFTVTVLLSPTPDLVVAAVDAPTEAHTGRTFTVEWMVRNDGADANDPWRESVYLSRDLILDRRLDAFLGDVEHRTGLAAAQTYEETLTAEVPAGYAGPAYVFVLTDAGDQVHERSGEDNNTGGDPFATLISLSPPTDLRVTSVIPPASGVAGQAAEIRYTVTNRHADNPAEGTWYDAVYLSSDPEWDIDDALVATVEVAGPTPAGASYQQAVNVALPGVLPGDYYVIVRADIRNLLRETDEHDNLVASAAAFGVDVRELRLGAADAGTLADAQSAYYYVDVPAGETLLLTLDSQSAGAASELYLRYGQMASRSQHDFAYSAPFESDQKIVVPFTQAGRYYVLAYGDSGGPIDYSVQARLLDFTVLDEDYGQAGNAGNLTLQINGAKFDRTVTAYLTDGSAAQRLWARSYYYVSQGRLYATFDLTRLAGGTYDLVVLNGEGAQAGVEDALEVVSARPAECTLTVDVAEFIFLDRHYPITFSWLNESLNDIPAPLLTLHSELEFGTEGEVLFSPNPAGPHHRTHVTLVGAASGDGPAGVIRPGQTVSMVMYAVATPLFSTHWLKIGQVQTDNQEMIDWDAVRTELRTQTPFADLGDSLFQTVFVQMQAQVGQTAGDYRAMLDRNATLLGWEYTSPRWPESCAALEFRKAWAAVGTSISGRGHCDDIAVDLSARTVTATDAQTGRVYTTTSLTDGSFIFENVLPGSYALAFDGALVQSGQALTVEQDQAVQNVVLTLSAGARLIGTARDAVTGLSLTDVRIQVMYQNGEQFTTVTGPTGQYALAALPPGTCTVRAVVEGKTPVELAGVVLQDGQQTVQNVDMPVSALIRGTVQLPANPPEGYELYVSAVQDDETGRPVTVTGNDFALAGIPAGTYELTFSRYGYVPLTLRNLAIVEGQDLNLGTVSLVRAGSVSGRVVPRPGTTISFLNGLVGLYEGQTLVAATMASSGGEFHIDTVPPGTYTARLMNLGEGISTSQQVTLLAGAQVTGVVLNILPGGTVTGLVTNTASVQPARNVTVSLFSQDGSSRSTSSDAAGRYRFESLPAGTYTVSVTSYGQAGTETVQVTSTDGTEVFADLSYGPVATLGGMLRTDDGLLVRDAHVELLEDGQVVATTRADLSGAYQFALLCGGTFTVRAYSNYVFFGASPAVAVDPGEQAMVNLTAGDGKLAVMLEGPDGPLEGVFRMSLTRLDNQASSDGRIEVQTAQAHTIWNLTSGDYRVEVEGEGLGGHATVTVGEGGTTALTVTLHEQHTLSGRVTGPDGAPWAGAWLSLISTADGTIVQTGISDAQGYYEIENIETGTHDLVVLAENCAARVVESIVVADTQVCDVAMSASAVELAGRLTGPDGVGVCGGVDVLDAEGRIIGQAVADADGSFLLSTVWGTGLTLRASAPGCGRVEIAGVNLPATGATDVGEVAMEPVAVAQQYTPDGLGVQAAKSAAATTAELADLKGAEEDATSPPSSPTPTPNTPANEPNAPLDQPNDNNPPMYPLDVPQAWVDYYNQARFQPANAGEAFPSYLTDILQTLGDTDKSDDHVDAGSYTLNAECINSCGSLFNTLNHQVTAQDLYWDALESHEDAVDQYANIATGLFLSEVATAAAYLGTAVATCYAVGAILGSATAAASLTASAAYTIANGVAGIASALWTAGVWIYDSVIAAPDPDVSKSQLAQAASVITAQSASVLSASDGIKDAIKAYKKVEAPNAYGCGILLGVAQLITGLEDALEAAALTETIPVLGDLGKEWKDYKFTLERYQASASKARQLLDELDACQQNCDDDDDQDDESARKPGRPTAPADPNDIVGPTGVGAERWVPVSEPMDYMIRFENDPVFANAPAHVVRITQQLDADLDYRTFRLGDFSIGTLRVDVPDNVPFYQTRLDLTGTRGVYVDVAAGIDMRTGQAFWLFTSLDPLTGTTPRDPMLGFLPPNQTSPEGQACVTYTVCPQRDSQTGTVVDAMATIVFDANEPIDTPPIFNTLDATPPATQVDPLPAPASDGTVLVSWSGQDDLDGSSFDTFTVYVSDGGGPFIPWLVNTSAAQAPFAGEEGHVYAFYCVAGDQAGNSEDPPTQPDAVVMFGADSDAPTAVLDDPADNEAADHDPAAGLILVNSAPTELVVQLSDDASGIKDDTVVPAALTLTRNGTVLTEGVDYTFYYTPATDRVSLFAAGGVALADGNYVITILADGVTDNADNGIAQARFELTVDTTPPGPADRHLQAVEDTLLTGQVSATDLHGPVTFSAAATTAHGQVTMQADGSFTYTPDADYNGPDSFTFQATDTAGNTAPGTVSLTVGAVNDPPQCDRLPDVVVDEDCGSQTLAAWATGLSPGPTDETGQALTFEIIANSNAALFAAGPAISPDGTLTFMPAVNAFGSTHITVVLHDDGGTGGDDTADEQTFTITVNPVNDAPTANALAATPDPVRQTTNLTLTTTADDPDGTIARVEFFRDANADGVGQPGEKLGEDADGGDGWSWTGAVTWAIGSHGYLAWAVDDSGAESTFAAAAGAVEPAGLWVRIGTGNPVSITFQDADGTRVTAWMLYGTADVFLVGAGLSAQTAQGRTIVSGLATATGQDIQVAEFRLLTGGHATQLVLTAAGGDGRFNTGSITGNASLALLYGPNMNLTGAGIVLGAGQGIQSLYLGDLRNGADLVLPTERAAPITVVLGQAGAGTDMTLGSPLGLLQVAGWTGGGNVTSPWASQVVSGGDFSANVTLNGRHASGCSLYQLSASGSLGGQIVMSGWAQSIVAAEWLTGRLESQYVGALMTTRGGLSAAIRMLGQVLGCSLYSLYVTGDLAGAGLELAGNITSLYARSWTGGRLDASVAGTVYVAGEMAANIHLTGLAAWGISLGTLWVGGEMRNAVVRTVGSIQFVRVAGIRDSGVYVSMRSDLQGLPTQQADFVAAPALGFRPALGTFMISSQAGTFVNSVLAAPSAGAAVLRNVTPSGTTPYGLAVNTSIGLYVRWAAAALVVARWNVVTSLPSQDNFHVDVI